MRMTVSIEERSVVRLLSDPDADALKCHALSENPFLESRQGLGRIVGLCDGQVAGGEYVFPLRLRTPKGVLSVLSGSTLSVDPRYRRSGLGMDLPELCWQKSPSKVALGAGLSQMAVPVYQLLDYVVFFLPRYLMLWKSRSVVEMKLSGMIAHLVSACVDVLIAGYALVIAVVARWRLGAVDIEEIASNNESSLEEVSKIILDERRLFSEVHDKAWLKWHLTASFSKYGPAKLFVVRRRNKAVAFFMTKRRFHEKASHRGFRNVCLGSIIEWGAIDDSQKLLPWILLRAALLLRKAGVDAVEIPTDDVKIATVLRRLGWRTVGEGSFTVKAGEGSCLKNDADMKNQSNWRLRPAMGDNGLS